MNVTNNLKLPQYTEEDIFDLQDINKAYDSIDKAYGDLDDARKEVVNIKDEIPKTNATAEVISARGGKETLGKRLDEFGSKLDTKANKNDISKFQKIIRYTDGFGDNGAVFGVMANVESNRSLEVCNYVDSKHTSSYDGRDSVAVYIHNEGCNPTLDVNNCIYGSNYVDVLDRINFNNVKVGMIIDTKHEPQYSSIIERIEENRIYVKEGWYENIKGGSTSPATPPSNAGFYVNLTTKIWGINNNVFLNDNTKTKHAVLCEYGLFGSKSDNNNNSISGVDLVNFGKMAPRYGFSVRSSKNANKFLNGYLVENSNNGFVHVINETNEYMLRSVKNSFSGENTQLDNYYILTDGTQSKIKGITSVINDNSSFDSESKTSFYYLNTTTELSKVFLKPSDVGSGVIKFIKNIGKPVLLTGSKFFIDNTASNSFRLESGESATLINDGGSWFVIGYDKKINKKCSMITSLTTTLKTNVSCVIFNIADGGTYTIPDANNYASGDTLILKNINASTLTIKSNIFINKGSSQTLSIETGKSITLFTDGASWIVV